MNHISVIEEKPRLTGKSSTPDGAYNGNGDLAVILGNQENGLRIYISKIDMWYGVSDHDIGGVRPVGYIDIDIPASDYDVYRVEQDMDLGELRCSFGNGKYRINIKVIKTDNIILIENNGAEISPVLRACPEESDGRKGKTEKDGLDLIFRSFDENAEFETHCFAALRKTGRGYVTVVATNHDLGRENSDGLEEYVISKALGLTDESVEKLAEDHYEAWKSFYAKSSFTLIDEFLELRWYASQYIMACTCGNGKFAPGLFGNFVTVEKPAWHSDYHLNYNYQAPFYPACSSNHVELTDTYHVPLEEFLENGKKDAAKFGCGGIIYPVGIGPKGIYTEYTPSLPHWFERLYLGQKNNGIHPADIMVFRWRATKDREYARLHAYPYLKECLGFFEDYAVFENGRYSVKDDAAHEVPMYRKEYDPEKWEYRYIHDKNNVVTLGLLRLCIPAAIEMAEVLGVDEDKRRIWQDMLDKLSPFPTTLSRYGRIYRYTEKGQRTHKDNDVGVQHIYPFGCIGLSSAKKDLELARRTLNSRKKICWHDGNAVSSFYPMAARLGINPVEILDNLREDRKEKERPNMLYDCGAGGLEYCPIVATTLNEMALQSHQDVIRIFPCWDKSIDASYNNLRADGAFLVSSSIRNGVIGRTAIISEAGSKLRMINPYEKCRVTRDGKTAEFTGEIYETDTVQGETIVFEMV